VAHALVAREEREKQELAKKKNIIVTSEQHYNACRLV
jgi:hypothetical protein